MRKRKAKSTFISGVMATVMVVGSVLSGFGGGTGEVFANEQTPQEKSKIYYAFEEITTADQFEVGEQYLFLTEKKKKGEAVVDIPDGSAMLEYIGKTLDEVKINMYGLDSYSHYKESAIKSSERYLEACNSEKELTKKRYDETAKEWKETITTEDQFLSLINDYLYGEYETYDEFLKSEDGKAFKGNISNDIDTLISLLYKSEIKYLDEYIADVESEIKYYQNTSESKFLSDKGGYKTWDEYAKNYEIWWYYDDNNSGAKPQAYVSVIKSGKGFDGCDGGQIGYNSEIEGYKSYKDAWWYACNGGGVEYGDTDGFYCYTYKTGEFTKDDIHVVLKNGYEIPNGPTVVTKDNVQVAIKVNGDYVTVSFFDIKDGNIDKSKNDNAIDIEVGGILLEAKVTSLDELQKDKVYEDVKGSEGEIKDITQSTAVTKGKSVYDAAIKSVTDEIKSALNISDEDKTKGVNVWIEVSDITADVSKEVKTLISNKAKTDALTTACILDINLFKKVEGEAKEQMHELSNKITISFKVPKSYLNNDSNNKREYILLREHNGVVTIIDGSFDEETGIVTFSTDKFSTYALAYKDTPVAVEKEETPVENDIPQTADTVTTNLYILFLIIAVGTVMFVKKKDETIE